MVSLINTRYILVFFTLFFILNVKIAVAENASTNNSNCNLTSTQITQIAQAITPAVNVAAISCHQSFLIIVFPPRNEIYNLQIPFNIFEEKHPFFGLADSYNGSRPIQMEGAGEVRYVDLPLEKSIGDTWIGWKGRFTIFMLTAPNAQIAMNASALRLQWPDNLQPALEIYIGPAEGQFSPIRYSYLWSWLAALCRGMESFLLLLHTWFGNWGVVIMVFAVLFKVVFLPLQLWVQKLQHDVNRCQALLAPKFKLIKTQYEGEDAHQRLMLEYKQLGITPFYTMKPLIGVFIQIPFLIVIFNVLGEMPALAGAPFLWIENLAYPDAIANFPFALPLLGNTLNLLPILMTVMTIVSTSLLTPAKEAPTNHWQKWRLYLMAGAFFILFYPFPASMVLFWTLINILYFVQQRIFK